MLIPKDKYEPFVSICRTVIEKRYKDAQQSECYGRLINTRRFDSLKEYLDKLHPSQILVGGDTDRQDLYISPTIVGPISPNQSGIMQDEIFGPILPIVPIQDIDEAIQIVNSK